MKRIFFKKIIIYLFLTITLSGVLSPNNIVFAQLDFTVTDQGDPNGDGNPSTTTTNTTIVEPVPIYNEKEYEPLAPLPGLEGPLDFSGDCVLGEYLNIFIKVFLSIITAIAVIMIVYGGINYLMSDLANTKEDAKSSIINAILGIIIALSAYIILNTINPKLLNLCLNNIPNQSISVSEFDEPQKLINGKYGKYTANAKWDENLAGDFAKLPRGVTVNSKECTYVGERSCTSTRGLNTSIVNNLANSCWESNGKKDCNIIITGGTENWLHSANGGHEPGSPVIDVRASTDVNFYITGKATPPTKDITITKNGVKYSYEVAHSNENTTGAHWHVHY